jgi:hypothetical protein
MATSGSTNFATSRDSLISGALRAAGAIAQGETPTATMVSEAAEALNMLVKAMQADGMPLWAIKKYQITLTASTADYTIGVGSTVSTPKPLKVIQAYLRNTSSSIDTPVRIITRDEYERLGNKTSSGEPVQIFYEPLLTTGVLHVFPVPDATVAAANTLYIIYQRPFEDFDASTDEPDFPQEYYHTLKFQLADVLAPEYGLSLQERQDLAARAKRTKDEALSFGTEEGSLYLMADQRDS